MLRMNIVTWLALAPLAFAQTYYSSALLSNANGQNGKYTGVASLSSYVAGCTAFFVDTRPAAADTAPAYVVTSGHCVANLADNTVIVDQPLAAWVAFNFFYDTEKRQVQLNASKIAYATMKGTDLAIVEMKATYGQLIAAGVRPLALSNSQHSAGERILAVGAPTEHMPPFEKFLRLGACTLGARADLIEFNWHWWGFYRNDCPDIYGGSSGSPVLAASTGDVIGVLNTGTGDSYYKGGSFDCYLGRPCELTPTGYKVVEETNYAAPVAGLADCFTAGGILDIHREGCPLDDGRQMVLTRPDSRSVQPVFTDFPGHQTPAIWNTLLSSDTLGYYRSKSFREGRGDCRDPAGYGPVVNVKYFAWIYESIGTEEGRYYLCVVAGASPVVDATWQDPRFASILIVKLDATPPVERPRYNFLEGELFFTLSFTFLPPEISSYDYKFGAPGDTRCEDPTGYIPYPRVPIMIAKSRGPYRVCARAADDALNLSRPIEILTAGVTVLPFGVVHAASYDAGPFAAGQLLTVYGRNFTSRSASAQGIPAPTTLGGVSVSVGNQPAALYFVSAGQINLLLPAGLPPGTATLAIRSESGETATAEIEIGETAPGLFVASALGNWSPDANFLVQRPDGSLSRKSVYSCAFYPDLLTRRSYWYCGAEWLEVGKPFETYYLELFGTGIRGAVKVFIGPQPVEVVYAGPHPTYPGLDQVNVRLPQPFGLNGYQKLELRTGNRSTSPLYVWFKNANLSP
jgi:hypothetical protein